MRIPALIFSCLILAAFCQARVITVDDDGPADFSTIQPGIDDANDGDILEVKPGEYADILHFGGKNIVVRSTGPKDASVVASTIVSGSVKFKGTEDATCVLSGFTLLNGICGADYCHRAAEPRNRQHTCATISHCVVRNHESACQATISSCDGMILNCVVYDSFDPCHVRRPALEDCRGVIRNCTIIGCGGPGGVAAVWGPCTIENCIIWHMTGESWWPPVVVAGEAEVRITYSNIQGGYEAVCSSEDCAIYWGPGNINAKPQFVRVGRWDSGHFVEGDYHLRSQAWRWDTTRGMWISDDVTSLCIDAGNPGSPLGEEPLTIPLDPNNEFGENLRINMGAYSGTAEASMGPHGWALLADLTNDGTVDFADYVHQLGDWHGTGSELPGDLDRNGLVDFPDLALFAKDWLRQTDWPGEMVLIPGGEFLMGDHFNEGYNDELPVHLVRLDSFYMARTELTNGQYCEFLNSVSLMVIDGVVYSASDSSNNYPYFATHRVSQYSQMDYADGAFSVRAKGGRDMSDDPVVEVSWYGAAAYCNWLSQQQGYDQCYDLSTWECDFAKSGYRLPTDAEWEYAARGGSHDPYYRFPWGNTITHGQANYYSDGSRPYDISPTRGFHPRYSASILPYTAPVGSFAPNGYGLYDVIGNVWEWCNDWFYHDYYAVSPYDNPTGPIGGTERVLRGGSYGSPSDGCRLAYHSLRFQPQESNSLGGFRVVLDLD